MCTNYALLLGRGKGYVFLKEAQNRRFTRCVRGGDSINCHWWNWKTTMTQSFIKISYDILNWTIFLIFWTTLEPCKILPRWENLPFFQKRHLSFTFARPVHSAREESDLPQGFLHPKTFQSHVREEILCFRTFSLINYRVLFHTCGRGLSLDKRWFYMVNCEWSLLHLRSVWNMKTYTRDLIKAKLVLSET